MIMVPVVNLTEALIEEKTQIEKELAQFEPKRRRLVLIAELLKSYRDDSVNQPKLFDAPSIAPNGRFSGLKTTAAVIAFLREKPTEFFTPREIGEALRAGGLIVDSPHFLTTLHTVCKRNTPKNFEAGTKKGIRAFRTKQ